MPLESIDTRDPTPRYLQVRRILEEKVRTGDYRPGNRIPGERDLARDLGVSQMTVNKAILALCADGWLRREAGNGTFVRDEFRPPVPDVVRIGFAVRTATERIGSDYYLSGLLQGIQRAVTNEPISLTLFEITHAEVFGRLANAPVDGLLLVDVLHTSAGEVARLAEAGKRIVIVGAEAGSLRIPYVDADNYQGGLDAMQHLMREGHSRIAGVFSYANASNTRRRLEAYRDALSSAGIVPPHCGVIGDDDPECDLHALRAGVARMLRGPQRPTAFYCGGYALAQEVIAVAAEQGLAVPDDVSVVGFDDPVAARDSSPSLTTVHQPLKEIGWRATTRLVEWLRTHEEPSPPGEVLPATLQVRESTTSLRG